MGVLQPAPTVPSSSPGGLLLLALAITALAGRVGRGATADPAAPQSGRGWPHRSSATCPTATDENAIATRIEAIHRNTVYGTLVSSGLDDTEFQPVSPVGPIEYEGMTLNLRCGTERRVRGLRARASRGSGAAGQPAGFLLPGRSGCGHHGFRRMAGGHRSPSTLVYDSGERGRAGIWSGRTIHRWTLGDGLYAIGGWP